MMKKLIVAAAMLMSGAVSAQWTVLTTGTDTRFNSIASHDGVGQVAVGLDLVSDSGAYGDVHYSADNGDTWIQLNPYSWENVEFRDVDFTPDGHTWIVGDSGYVCLRTIASSTFETISRISPYALYAGFAVNDSTFYCAGAHGVIFRSDDRGYTWDTLSSLTTETIYDLYFSDAANGWLVGDGGIVKTTADSGATWSHVQVPTFGFTDFRSFDYQDSLGVNPYLVGEAGYGSFSIDGGANWNAMATGSGETLNRIRFGTFNAGLIVGNSGFIIRTDNGGWTWFNDPSSETVDFFGIAYAHDTTAFICGDSGVIIRSSVNISSVQPHATSYFSSVAYPNPTTGPLNLQLQLNEQSDITIDVLNIAGEIIYSEYHENVSEGQNTLQLDLSAQPSGVYFVRISNGYSAVNLRVIR